MNGINLLHGGINLGCFNMRIYLRFLIHRFHIVYIIMIIQGVGTLLPWNMFITAHAVSICCIISQHHRVQIYTKTSADMTHYTLLTMHWEKHMRR